MKSLFLVALFTGITFLSFTQTVKSKTYSVMLDNLLSHTVDEVSVSEVKSDSISVVFLDAREINEYQVSHIKNAIWVGYDQFQKDSVTSIPKNQKIIVYCSVGYRSEKIAEKLEKMGYKDVSNLYGGLFEWSNEKRPMVQGEKNSPTKKIHPYDSLWGQWISSGEKAYK